MCGRRPNLRPFECGDIIRGRGLRDDVEKDSRLLTGSRWIRGRGVPQQQHRHVRAMAIGLALLGAVVCVQAGRRGLMPLDQSIVFDGAWRILHGELPYRDFVVPNGVTPMAMQALLFAVGGVSWWTYVAHAAVLNGLATVMTFGALRHAGLPAWCAAAYGALGATVVYAPMGTPYIDQHAFVGVMSVWALAVRIVNSGTAGGAWGLGPILVAALLAKQIPSAFGFAAVLVPLITCPGCRWQFVWRVTVGTGATVVLLLGVAWWLDLDWSKFHLYGVALPALTGAERWSDVASWSLLDHLQGVAQVFPGAKEIRGGGAIVLITLPLAMLATCRLASRSERHVVVGLALLAALAFVISYLFQSLTWNDRQNGWAMVPLAIGLTHASWQRVWSASVSPHGMVSRLWWWTTVALTGIVVWHAVLVHQRIVQTRLVNDLTFIDDRACGDDWPPALAGLIWSVPDRIATSCLEFSALASHLRRTPVPFWLVGDATVLYAVAGQLSPLPTVFLHDGLTVPREEATRVAFENNLLRRLRSLGVRRLVFEGTETWMGMSLADFPRVAAAAAGVTCDERRFGAYRVIDLCATPTWESAESGMTVRGGGGEP